MKKIFSLTAFLLLATMVLHAQDNLVFSQVKLVTTSESVPTGKVWKVVGVAGSMVIKHNRTGTTVNGHPVMAPNENSILINGTAVSVGNPSVGAGAGNGYSSSSYGALSTIYANVPTTFPLWLPAGTSLAVSDNVSFISVIEFDVQ